MARSVERTVSCPVIKTFAFGENVQLGRLNRRRWEPSQKSACVFLRPLNQKVVNCRIATLSTKDVIRTISKTFQTKN